MPLVALTNERWSYDTNCFVCEPSNTGGLRIPFFHDTDARRVVAEFTLDHTYSGAPTLVHGGVSLAIIDEAMAWAAVAIAGKWAMTIETHTSFPAPVLVDRPHAVTAWVDRVVDDHIHTGAQIEAGDGTTCTRSSAEFLAVSEAVVLDHTGRPPAQHERAMLGDD